VTVAPTFLYPGAQVRLIAVSQSFRKSVAKDRVRAELALVLREPPAAETQDVCDIPLDFEEQS